MTSPIKNHTKHDFKPSRISLFYFMHTNISMGNKRIFSVRDAMMTISQYVRTWNFEYVVQTRRRVTWRTIHNMKLNHKKRNYFT